MISKKKKLTKGRCTINLVRPMEKTLAQHDSIKDHAPFPHLLLLLDNQLHPLPVEHWSRGPQNQIVVLASEVYEVDPMLALRIGLGDDGWHGARKTTISGIRILLHQRLPVPTPPIRVVRGFLRRGYQEKLQRYGLGM